MNQETNKGCAHTDIEGVITEILENSVILRYLTLPQIHELRRGMRETLTALVEGAREEEAVRCADHEKQAYELGKVDGKRERDAELREKIKTLGHQQDDDSVWCNMDAVLKLLTPNDNQI